VLPESVPCARAFRCVAAPPLVALALLATQAVSAFAGEVRMDLSSSLGNVFVDPTQTGGRRFVNCNFGDHVVWVWVSGAHGCTSGDSETVTPDGHWDSGTQSASTPGKSFSWQATGTGSFPFYCNPHAPGMAGHIFVASSGIAVSDLRLTEVLYNDAGGLDKVEVTNMGAANGDLGRYRLSIANGVAQSLAANSIPIAPGGTVTIHTNESGTNTATDVFLPALGNLPDVAGSVALYAPNTKVGTLLTDATQIVDFVQWGTTGNPNEATAISGSVWSGGQAAPAVAAGHTIEFCGGAQQHAGHWYDNATPNFGGASDNCATPAHTATWGRIKLLYR
jgi:plastocyanin